MFYKIKTYNLYILGAAVFPSLAHVRHRRRSKKLFRKEKQVIGAGCVVPAGTSADRQKQTNCAVVGHRYDSRNLLIHTQRHV